jgi:hypothetical protein
MSLYTTAAMNFAASKTDHVQSVSQQPSLVSAIESPRFMERAIGIELHPKFLGLNETRRHHPLRESNVVNNATSADRSPAVSSKNSYAAVQRIHIGISIPSSHLWPW